MKKITIFCAIFFIVFSAFAQRPVTILGAYSCGKWVEYRKENRTEISHWVYGFLASENFKLSYNPNMPDILLGVGPESLDLWMDKYCRENPLNSVSSGVTGLVIDLLVKAPPMRK